METPLDAILNQFEAEGADTWQERLDAAYAAYAAADTAAAAAYAAYAAYADAYADADADADAARLGVYEKSVKCLRAMLAVR
ncbi:MAG: hypothetical protein IPH13_20255 [Planctomycetes bacterium]|nr:hypothetical protein [Planctomycetota bacterium]